MKFDLHVHSLYSWHARPSTKTIVKYAKKKNIGVALTDHNTTIGWQSFSYYAKKYNVPFILGEEIKVYDKGEFLGEILGLFMNSPVKGNSLFDVIAELKKQDAIIAVAHPFDIFRKPLFSGFKGIKKILKDLHAIECFNSRCILNFANKKALEFAKVNDKACIAGSDAHFANEIGNALTLFNGNSAEDLREAILKKRTRIKGFKSDLLTHVKVQLVKYGLLEVD